MFIEKPGHTIEITQSTTNLSCTSPTSPTSKVRKSEGTNATQDVLYFWATIINCTNIL